MNKRKPRKIYTVTIVRDEYKYKTLAGALKRVKKSIRDGHYQVTLQCWGNVK